MSRQRSLGKILSSDYVSIGELARLTGVRYSTLKYYTEEHLLPFEQDDEHLTRHYKRLESIDRIQEIKKLKEQKLSILEIKSILVKE